MTTHREGDVRREGWEGDRVVGGEVGSRRGASIAMLGAAIVLAGVLVALLMVAVLVPEKGPGSGLDAARAAAAKPDEVMSDLSIPPFELTDQLGRSVSNSMFDDRVTIIDFTFTSCPLACPKMKGEMTRLAYDLEGTGVQIVSFSIDPAHDTPAVLKAYAEETGVSHDRWRFLTGEQEVVWRIVREGLRFAISEMADSPITRDDGTVMLNIQHPTHFVLIGPDRRVLAMYSSLDAEALRSLAERVRALSAHR
ncbi:MAG: SCO family protein [Phycisphaerales bacterium]|nr:SCO family protein [Phycisphaerales bacterium]